MRLKLILPTVDPTQLLEPTTCPRPGCGGQHFQLHQAVPNPCATHASTRRPSGAIAVGGAATPSASTPTA